MGHQGCSRCGSRSCGCCDKKKPAPANPCPPSPFTGQVDWWVDEQNVSGKASNKNSGANKDAPLADINEVSRRLCVAKYCDGFGPYVVHNMSDVTSVGFEWTFQLDPCGTIETKPTSGVIPPILRFLGVPTVLSTGAVGSFTPAVPGASPALLTPSVGAFGAGTVLRFTSGAAAGGITEIGNAAGAFDPFGLPGTPAPGDAFEILSLPKFNAEIVNAGGQQGHKLEVVQHDLDPARPWEIVGALLFIIDSVVRKPIAPGIGARVRLQNSLFLPATLTNYIIQRGTIQFVVSTIVNAIVEPHAERGRFQDIGGLWLGSAVRMGNTCATFETYSQFGNAILDSTQFFDWPSVLPADPEIGGAGDPGAAINVKRSGTVAMDNAFGFPVGGVSSNPGTVGLWMAESANVMIKNETPKLSGAAGDITFDGGCRSILTVDCATGAVSASAVALTSWTGAGGWDDPATINKNAMSLRNGTRLHAVA